MRTSLSHRCARFLDARDMLRRAFPFAHAQMIPICAGMAAGQDRPWDAGRLYACRDLIQEETGLFSNFRGAGHLAVITLLALSPAPEERMAFALQGYKVLRTRFYASQYLPLAALLLADWARGRDLDGVAGGLYLHAPGQALAPGQHHAADGVVPHMLGHFHDPDGPVLLHGKGLTDAGQMPRLKLHVHHGT